MNRSKNRRRNSSALLVLLPLAALGGPALAGLAFLFAGMTF